MTNGNHPGSENSSMDHGEQACPLRNKIAEDETTLLPHTPTAQDLSGKVSAPMVGHTDLEALMKQLDQPEASDVQEGPAISHEPTHKVEPVPDLSQEPTRKIEVIPDDLTRKVEAIPDTPTQKIGQIPEVPFVPPVLQEDFHLPLTEEEQIEQTYRNTAGDSPRNGSSGNKKVLLVSLCGIFLVVLMAVIGFFLFASASDPYDGQILNNVLVADVNLGGLTRKEAEAVLTSVTGQTFSRQDMVVEFPQATLTLKPENTNVHLDVKSAVKAAYSYGRTGSKDQRKQDYEASLTGNHIVSLLPHLRLDEKYIRSQLSQYAETILSAFAPSSYALEGTMPELQLDKFDPDFPCQTLMLTLGTQGASMDQDQVYNRILDGYGMNQFFIRIEDMEVTQTPEPLDLEKIYEEVTIEPVDSAMDLQNFQVVPGSYGYSFDLEEAQKLLEKADYGDTVTIPMEYVEPEILDDEVFFQDVLGEGVTKHNDNPNRNENLKVACKTLNGMVLYPGDSFSFNEALGKRTADKGYKPAPAYSGNQLVNSLGGGICQVSSTLYYTCLLSDLEILDRINHGISVSYIDKGLDATVSWGGPDFKFRNNTNFPIKIEAEADDEEVRIRILGTDEKSYYVKMETEITSHIPSNVLYEKHGPDDGYRDGQVIRGGSDGYLVKSYRCKYDKQTNKLISRDFEASSSYMKVDTILASVKTPEPTVPPTVETEPSEAPTEPPVTETPTVPPETETPKNTTPSTEPQSTEE